MKCWVGSSKTKDVRGLWKNAIQFGEEYTSRYLKYKCEKNVSTSFIESVAIIEHLYLLYAMFHKHK